MRKNYPPVRFEDNKNKKLKIIDCIERAWSILYINYITIKEM